MSARAFARALQRPSAGHSPRKAAKRLMSFSCRPKAAASVAAAASPVAALKTAARAAGRSRWSSSAFKACAVRWRSGTIVCLGAGCLALAVLAALAALEATGAALREAAPPPRPVAAPPVQTSSRRAPSCRSRYSLAAASNQKRRLDSTSKKMPLPGWCSQPSRPQGPKPGGASAPAPPASVLAPPPAAPVLAKSSGRSCFTFHRFCFVLALMRGLE
mmetsp:Transcript_30016/g.94004  ORF Transcript_30016/g.94004 Transcript_30016/m.94004 type:complete len:217 (-) Transcript_30016:91-741(-)